MTGKTKMQLLSAARQAARLAYCPYSNFRVGAAVLAEGEIFTGVNVENASYGLTLCAERSALAAAISAGKRKITDLALVCLDAGEGDCLPCGACRQWLSELAPQARIHLAGREQPLTVEELLPFAFKLDR